MYNLSEATRKKSNIFPSICGSEQNFLILSGPEVGDPAHLLHSTSLTPVSANQRPGWLGLDQSEGSQQISGHNDNKVTSARADWGTHPQ